LRQVEEKRSSLIVLVEANWNEQLASTFLFTGSL